MIIKRDEKEDLIIKFDKNWYLDEHESFVTDAICYETDDLTFEAFFNDDFMISICSDEEDVYIPCIKKSDNPYSFLYELSKKIGIEYEVLDTMYKLNDHIIYNGEGDEDYIIYFRYKKQIESKILRHNESVKDKLKDCVTGKYYKMYHQSSDKLFNVELDDIYKHVYEYTNGEDFYFLTL